MCPVRTDEVLACPARFERATYALEEIAFTRKFNEFKWLLPIIGTV